MDEPNQGHKFISPQSGRTPPRVMTPVHEMDGPNQGHKLIQVQEMDGPNQGHKLIHVHDMDGPNNGKKLKSTTWTDPIR